VDLSGGRLAFDVVPETLRRTTLGAHRPGRRVNLERALRLGEELGGHLVQGHVEGTVELVALERSGADVRLTLALPSALDGGVIPKGSVALDGVSLTVGQVWRDPQSGERFSVYLIPHTLALTTLAERRVGDRLNLEPDAMWRAWEQRQREGLGGGPAMRLVG
jgi:riboflavin synthase